MPFLKIMLSSLTTGVLLMAAMAAQAQDGTPSQRNACKPDVFRLCRDYIPNRQAITNCLERNRANLTPACHAVFASPAK